MYFCIETSFSSLSGAKGGGVVEGGGKRVCKMQYVMFVSVCYKKENKKYYFKKDPRSFFLSGLRTKST